MNDLNKFNWLIGQWEGIVGPGIYHEEWDKISEDEITGRAYMIKKGEISNNEKLKIHLTDKNIFYTADVSHNPEPVSFKLTSGTDEIFVFENPGHDFPQKITYEKKSESNFIATVEATKEGKIRKFEYDLKRIV